MLAITYYTTDKGILLKTGPKPGERSWNTPSRINGKPLQKTFRDGWLFVEGEAGVSTVERHCGTRRVNERYEITNPSLACAPTTIKADEVSMDSDGVWIGEHAGMQSLYKLAYEEEDAGFEAIEFEANKAGEFSMDALGDPTKFRYSLGKVGGWDKPEVQLSYADLFAQYEWATNRISSEDIVKAVVPDFAWHLYPCRLSSQTSYQIVRAHVQSNIDPRWAVITSDYDFCFSVAKRIRKKPVTYTSSEKLPRVRKPLITRRTENDQKIEVFRMGHDQHPYREYYPIEGFSGKSLEGLMETIDGYLSYLMDVINSPVAQCQHCDGRGVVSVRTLATNERQALQIEAGKEGK